MRTRKQLIFLSICRSTPSNLWRSCPTAAEKGFYTKLDLGIVKYHFEVGAGKDQFEWDYFLKKRKNV